MNFQLYLSFTKTSTKMRKGRNTLHSRFTTQDLIPCCRDFRLPENRWGLWDRCPSMPRMVVATLTSSTSRLDDDQPVAEQASPLTKAREIFLRPWTLACLRHSPVHDPNPAQNLCTPCTAEPASRVSVSALILKKEKRLSVNCQNAEQFQKKSNPPRALENFPIYPPFPVTATQPRTYPNNTHNRTSATIHHNLQPATHLPRIINRKPVSTNSSTATHSRLPHLALRDPPPALAFPNGSLDLTTTLPETSPALASPHLPTSTMSAALPPQPAIAPPPYPPFQQFPIAQASSPRRGQHRDHHPGSWGREDRFLLARLGLPSALISGKNKKGRVRLYRLRSGLHYELDEMSYELIEKKERRGETGALPFLPLDGSFQNIKIYRLPQTLGAALIYFICFYFRFSHQPLFFFLLQEIIIIIPTTLAVCYLILFPNLGDIFCCFCRYHRYPFPPKATIWAFLWWRERKVRTNL